MGDDNNEGISPLRGPLTRLMCRKHIEELMAGYNTTIFTSGLAELLDTSAAMKRSSVRRARKTDRREEDEPVVDADGLPIERGGWVTPEPTDHPEYGRAFYVVEPARDIGWGLGTLVYALEFEVGGPPRRHTFDAEDLVRTYASKSLAECARDWESKNPATRDVEPTYSAPEIRTVKAVDKGGPDYTAEVVGVALDDTDEDRQTVNVDMSYFGDHADEIAERVRAEREEVEEVADDEVERPDGDPYQRNRLVDGYPAEWRWDSGRWMLHVCHHPEHEQRVEASIWAEAHCAQLDLIDYPRRMTLIHTVVGEPGDDLEALARKLGPYIERAVDYFGGVRDV